MRFATLAVLCLLLAAPAAGAKPTDAGPARDITMNMQDAELRAMIQWMADISGKNFIVHKDVKGIATVVSAEPVSVDEAWQMFLQVLELNGFAAVSSGSSVKIVPAPTAARTASSGAAGSAGDINVSIIRLRQANAQELSQQFKPLLSEAGVISHP